MTVPVLVPIHSRKTLEQSPHKGMSVKYLVLNRVNPDNVLEQETSKCRISLSQLRWLRSTPEMSQPTKPLYTLRQLPFLFRVWNILCMCLFLTLIFLSVEANFFEVMGTMHFMELTHFLSCHLLFVKMKTHKS